MAFLPFYIPAARPPRIIIAGGGYAGMAALVSLRRHCPEASVTLIDPRTDHLKITRLHELLRPNPVALRVPFAHLCQRFAFRHVRAALALDEASLWRWYEARSVTVAGEELPFDYLLLATGTPAHQPTATAEELYGLEDLSHDGITRLCAHLKTLPAQHPITVIGAGATGIQFLCELAEFCQTHGRSHPLRLIDAGACLPAPFSRAMADYVTDRLREGHVDYRPNTLFHGLEGGRLRLENRLSGAQSDLEAGLTLCLTGKASKRLQTNVYGQVLLSGTTLTSVFSAGDCACYRGPGSNAMTAQAAVRKGKLCARNILRHAGRWKVLEPYLHRDLGYVVSLGRRNAIGWLGAPCNIVAGSPAVVLKEWVETQHDLLLAGIDTYVV